MAIILISGGTGLIGKVLSNYLCLEGHEVRILSRFPNVHTSVKSYFWDVEKNKIDERAFINVEHIIHLAGSGIADKRWTLERKKEIINSRVNSIKLITNTLKKNNIQLKSFVGASAIGIYGMDTSEKIYTEFDTGKEDFLSKTCVEWENSYKEIQTLSDRNCIIRIGVVLSSKGGALKKLIPLFKLGLGSAVGSGKQYMPWIHIDDLVSIFNQSIFNHNFNGVYNAVSPQHTTNTTFSKQLANALSKPFFLPNVPKFILKIIFGEMANVLLKGSRISSQKLTKNGFHFKFNTISEALNNIISKHN